MNVQSDGTGPGPSSKPESEFQELLIKRDGEGPLSFAGVVLAKATRQSGTVLAMQTLEAALYKTRGGKFVTTLSKTTSSSLGAISAAFRPVEDQAGPDPGYHKAVVHESFESAVDWFRPGRLTDEIRQQLGLDQPVRIE
jgi:hypothetical protein